MGALNFDPSQWLDAADRDPAKVANRAKVEPVKTPTLATVAALADRLPTAIERGLLALPRLAGPSGVNSTVWEIAVRNALRLRDDGWASQALAMGWPSIHLFGWSGSPYASDQSFVEWLGDRSVRAILEDRSATTPGAVCCIVVDAGEGRRAAFNMRKRDITKLIWEVGR